MNRIRQILAILIAVQFSLAAAAQEYKYEVTEKKISKKEFAEAYKAAEVLRSEYDVSLFRRPKKMKGFLDRLEAGGFAGFTTGGDIEFFNK